MSEYKYNTPAAAYKEAQRRINKAIVESAHVLFLSGLGLTDVPLEIAKLANLKEIFLFSNQLTTVPPEIAQLTKLRILDLRNNQLTAIPTEIVSQYENPQIILGYVLALEKIRQAEAKLRTENKLDLTGLKLTIVPPEIAHLANLIELDLGDNQITAIPPEIVQLTKLTKLGLNDNQLTIIPPEIAHLTNLIELDLGNNQIWAISNEITQLTDLQSLILNNNQLTTVPSGIAQLTNLIKFDLGNNQIKSIPPEITQLTDLQSLILSNNQLTAVPLEIAQLTKLTELGLNNNQLTAVPSDIIQLANLEYLDLHRNPGLPIPPEIVAQKNNAQTILNYLRERQEEPSHPLNEAKIILVGQGGVGKTSIVKRLVNNSFDLKEDRTKGIRIEKWSVDVLRPHQDTVSIALNIWDFGGQEILHATHQFFLTERSLYLLVLDARQGEEEGRVEYWLSLINSLAPAAPILIIINKIDQILLDVDRRGLQKKYPAIQEFIPTSARDGTGIDNLKTNIINILATMPDVDSLFPASWMRVKEELSAMQAARNFIPYTEYQQLCHANGVDELDSQETLIHFLHDLGVTLNFHDDDRVRETSVLNPNWVTRGVYTLLNSPELQKACGILHRNQVGRILPAHEYPANQRYFLLEMMLKFELAYEMTDRQTLLIPDLLTKEEPEFEWDNKTALQFAYQYQVLPRSILHRFMVRQHNLVDPYIRWRTGVLLHYEYYNNLHALIKADIEAKTIHISISGDGNQRQFLYSLRLVFAGIHESVSGTKPKEVVPIPGHPTVPPILYSYLEKLEAMGLPDEQLFPGMDEVLSVQYLLNGITTSAMRQSGLPSRQEILAALNASFNEKEFYDLLFTLGINRNKFAGSEIENQMRECVLFMERNGRLADLVAAMVEERPRLDFKSR